MFDIVEHIVVHFDIRKGCSPNSGNNTMKENLIMNLEKKLIEIFASAPEMVVFEK